jgi:uncharacterized protein (DUF362 family)
MSRVGIREVCGELCEDISFIFNEFGGIERLVGGRPVLLKPNGVHYGPGQATATEFIEALFRVLKDSGIRDLFLMENCTAGNVTRVVFRALGWDKLCRRYGVKAIYLDEGRTVRVKLPDEALPVDLPAFLHHWLVERREECFYLNIPRLKTHSMSHVTLGIKNQQGLLIDKDRMRDHNYNLGRRLVRILRFVRPDFTLIEGITATIYGHFPILRDLKKSIIDTRIIIGSDDILAADTVGARVLGYSSEEIDHMRIAKGYDLGCGDLDRIEIVGDSSVLARFKERYPYMPEVQIPLSIRRIYGKEMACYQGCRGNTEITIDMLAGDYGGRGGWNFVCGKGIDLAELEGLEGDFLVVGPCAVAEVSEWLKERYPGRRIFLIPEHNDLAGVVGKAVRLMRPNIRKILPFSIPMLVYLVVRARIRGLNSRMVNPV